MANNRVDDRQLALRSVQNKYQYYYKHVDLRIFVRLPGFPPTLQIKSIVFSISV